MTDYIELKVEVDEELRDAAISELADLGFESFVDDQEGFLAYIRSDEYSADLLKRSEFIQKHADRIRYSDTLIKWRNWNAEWESSFQPVDVDGQCMIRASFHGKPANYEYDIVIDPNMSFGTGHHETTWLMTKEMLGMNIEGRRVLDMGCGTAVLAILAAKKDAKEILAIDIEEVAVKNSEENIRLNNVNNIHITVKKGDSGLLADREFDIILANINKNVLLADIPRYSHCLTSGGELLMSGFFETDASTITEKAAGEGLTLLRKNLKNQWCLLHFVKDHLPH